MTSRRDFIGRAALPVLALSLPTSVRRALAGTTPVRSRPRGTAFVDLLREPDAVFLQNALAYRPLARSGAGRWTLDDVEVHTGPRPEALAVSLLAPATPIERLHLRWRHALDASARVLGDAWERGYGDLEWRGLVPDRVMPWYFATHDAAHTHCYGVRTGGGALCYWQADADGISLWADVRSGGGPLRLGARALDVCEVACRAGVGGESAYAALHAFCRAMCPRPLVPARPVYGSNDWYWAYGNNSADSVLRDAHTMAELAPPTGARPFVVIDDGWQPGRGRDRAGAGTWDRGNEKFPDMPGLAAQVHATGALPGVWMRPLQASDDVPDAWRLSRARNVLDPTVPEVQQKIAADLARIRDWGFALVKHDYSTFDLLGRWGSQMGAALTKDGWTFAAGSARTTAEVIGDLYHGIGTAAGDALVIGCNTLSHLSAGAFAVCRIGDDTSGTDWARTRKMGVNSLAFRGAQQGAFYAADPDCAAVTTAVPWGLERQWLDLVARSGTSLFVSIAPDALGGAQRRDVQAALATAASRPRLGEPLDWLESVYPSRWRLMGRERTYDWVGADGAGAP